MSNQSEQISSPQISVIMMTYNHEKYIEQAIKSVLSQQTEYYFELIVGNDKSTDSTASIVQKLAETDERISLIDRNENIGLHRNIDDLINRAKGQYVALLEGDDFWTVNDKLQRQVKYLEANPDCGQCFTGGYTFFDDKPDERIPYSPKSNVPEKFDLEYYLQNQFNPPSNTKIFRKAVHPKQLPGWFFEVTQWDTALHILHAIEHNISYLNFESLAWRRHANAYSFSEKATGAKRYEDWITLSKGLKSVLPRRFWKYLYMETSAHAMLSIVHLRNGNTLGFLKEMTLYFVSRPYIKSGKEIRDYLWRVRNKTI